jgi:two-component system chemotaxis sensor kinase CheA
MVRIEENTETVSQFWEEQIGAIATRVMIDGLVPQAILDLRSMGARAKKAGLMEVAAAAKALLLKLSQNSGLEAVACFQDGVAELRRALNVALGEPIELPANAYQCLADDAEMIAGFVTEAREHLSQIEAQMLTLEKDPTAIEVLHTVFRAFHTIKGLAGFLAFDAVQAVSHEVETLLDLARNHELTINSAIVDVVLESSDYLLGEIATIERVVTDGAILTPADSSGLVERIKRLAVRDAAPVALDDEVDSAEQLEAVVASLAKGEDPAKVVEELVADQEDWFVQAVPVTEIPVMPLAAGVVEATGQALSAAIKEVASVPASAAPVETEKAAAPFRHPEGARALDASTVRVETAKLDHLMNMVGEMVIVQSLIRHSQVLLSSHDSRLIGDLSQLGRVTAEVQRATMAMRMVPIGQVFQRIERVIRDLSRKAGKQVILQTTGAETEIDKTVAEELCDPLLHMVRNSVDHGIEHGPERIAAGKDAVAVIRLAAYHQGGQVVVSVSDDGRGLDTQKIRAKAEQRGLVRAQDNLTDEEVNELIFEPGFSTADQISDVSGRGVGMDVVRRNVEKLRGRLETSSVLGGGTTFLIKLPLTLAIIEGLVVELGENRYIIPLSVVQEIFRPPADTLFTVEGRDEMVLVREHLLPVVRLGQRLGIEGRSKLASDGLLVVIESEHKRYCLLVDDLVGKQEVVIKSLGETFKGVCGFSGCAVLGDGRVGLILDTDGIYRGRRR